MRAVIGWGMQRTTPLVTTTDSTTWPHVGFGVCEMGSIFFCEVTPHRHPPRVDYGQLVCLLRNARRKWLDLVSSFSKTYHAKSPANDGPRTANLSQQLVRVERRVCVCMCEGSLHLSLFCCCEPSMARLALSRAAYGDINKTANARRRGLSIRTKA